MGMTFDLDMWSERRLFKGYFLEIETHTFFLYRKIVSVLELKF